MARSSGSGWFVPARWTDEVADWFGRRAEHRAATPEERLELAEKRLATSRAKQGDDSWRTINAMEAVAKGREVLGQYAGALPLRREVVRLRKKQLGSEHPLTLAAEARLAVNLIEIHRPGEAKPLLVHVRDGLTAAQGPDDPTVLAVTERLADVELSLGESEPARRLLEEEMALLVERGEDVAASAVAVKLASALIRDGEYPAAADLLRGVVDVRSRVLGPDDPDTLTARRNLVSSLVWTKDFAEASIVARNLADSLERTRGPDHTDTEDARRLVENIDRELREG